MSNPKPGDLVRLASGGPTMTVNRRVIAGGPLECVWFVGEELKWGEFADESLVPSVEPPGSTETQPSGTFPPP